MGHWREERILGNRRAIKERFGGKKKTARRKKRVWAEGEVTNQVEDTEWFGLNKLMT